MTSKITLAMIVKDEVGQLQRVIRSARPVIANWIIVDTGSTDETRTLVETMLYDIPGELVEREWVNFGHNRTELIQLARPHGQYLLLLDADDELIRTEDAPELTAPAYQLPILDGGPVYTQPRLVRTDIDWRYIGTTHEYIVGGHSEDLTCWQVQHHCDGSRRSRKFVEDEQMLRAELLEDPNNERLVFYLANTLRDQGKYKDALQFYQRRAHMGGWVAEANLARNQAQALREGRYEALGVPS